MEVLLWTLGTLAVLIVVRFLLAASWLAQTYDEYVRLDIEACDIPNPVWQMFDLTQWRYRSPFKTE